MTPKVECKYLPCLSIFCIPHPLVSKKSLNIVPLISALPNGL